MIGNWKNSLIQMIAAVVVAVEVLVLTALGMFYTEWFSRQLDKGLEESVRIPGALMNRQLLRYQSVSDKAVMTELVGDRFEDGMVVGTDGIIYYAYRPDLLMRPVSSVPGVDPGWFSGESDVPWVLRQTKAGKGYLVSVTPVTAYQGGRPFFHVYVRVATDETEALKFRVFALFVVGSAACVFLTSMVILLFLRQRVTRPLEELERSADNLASGDLDHHVPVHRHDEIGSLARSLDRMRGAIRQKLDELRELNVDLRERKARMKALLDALPDAVFIVDENGRYLEVYTGRAHLLLDDPVAMRGRLMSDFVDQETAERFMTVVETTLAGESVVLEYPLAVHGGHFWFEGRTARLDREHGEASVIWVSRDITARKHMEERLRQARDVAEAANLRLMELDKAKSGLVSSVSHELRTPLTSLLGFAKLILKNFSRHFLTLAGG
ncbi:HAMP domain-containing protein [Pseudodesulfovibrio tunisiensis]|uniref:HAMP domain-containing protein n=1 Tax=Pseudodesulfovibrio tunisiensis TaxID=463192 RepID=UPI001FB3CDF4|nr:HAMP domain-containing protein [Pseudodesulfovibrio tunisiensis]